MERRFALVHRQTDLPRDSAMPDRECDTIPHGLTPPDKPADFPDGAPEWARILFNEIHAGREDTRRILRNQDLISRQFASFRHEARARLHAHETELGEIREELQCLCDRVYALEGL